MKKLLSVVLAAIMLLTLTVPAFAAEEKKDYEGNPVVIVRGIPFTNIRYEDGSSPMTVNAGEILGLLVQSVVSRFAMKNEDALYEAFAEAVYNVFQPISYDKNGNPVNDLKSTQYTKSLAEYPNYGYFNDAEGGLVREAVNRYGAENVYLFTYDWRKSAEQLAGELDSLIETAKADSDKKKVDIICASMGCMVTTAYFYYHGYDSVNKAVYVAGAHNGVYSVGDAFSGKISLDSDTVRDMVYSMLEGNVFAKFFINVLDWLGAFDLITADLNRWIGKYFDRANEDVFRDCLGTLPGFWAMCPDDRFDEAYATVYGDCEDEYAGVCDIIKETRSFVMNTDKTIEGAYEAGIAISFISGYNLPGVPVYDDAVLNGDGVIETVLTSNGATVALRGEVLSDEYIAAVEDKSCISPDRVVDASTAAYKDYTWFIRDAEHVATDYGTECNAFVFWLFEYEGQPTVNSNEAYPRFLVTDSSWKLDALR